VKFEQVGRAVLSLIFLKQVGITGVDPYVTRETLQEMGLCMIIVLILFRLLMMILLLMSLDMILLPMETSVGSFTGAPFEGPFCSL
jgi:hypothetical protein